jgi:5-(carboxyamino)imidazole ribonucleotide synthase
MSSPAGRGSARVGMVGAGQLARMTQQAAIDLDVELVVLAEAPEAPAVRAGARAILGPPDDLAALRRLAAEVDVVTFDHELVPEPLVRTLVGEGVVVRPGPDALSLAQDKLRARERLRAWGFPVPRFAPAPTPEAVAELAEEVGWPIVVKARRGGYDGRGVEIVSSVAEAAAVLARGGEWFAEAAVDLAAEVAVLLARRPSGEVALYPVVGTHQQEGICRELVMPAPLPEGLARDATALAMRLADAVDAIGIMATELFVDREGRLVVNEVALRPHNTGHATIESCATSQFHQHLRAVLDWPLGSTALLAPAALVNVLGPPDGSDPASRLPAALAVPDVAVHLYGKVSRPGRKLGHVSAQGSDIETALAAAREAASRLEAGSEDTPRGTGRIGRTAGVDADTGAVSGRALPETGGGPPADSVPVVGVVMGSDSDLSVMQPAADVLRELGVEVEVRVVSAHRTPREMLDYASSAAARGLRVVVAGAGGAAHLPGMLAAATRLPVIGVPVPLRHLDGVDSLLSIVQMPSGVPVATVGVGNGRNAGLLAARILALSDPVLRARLEDLADQAASHTRASDARVRAATAPPRGDARPEG